MGDTSEPVAPQLGRPVPHELGYLFKRTARVVHQLVCRSWPERERVPWLQYYRAFAAGQVCVLRQARMPGLPACVWYGLFTAPSQIIAAQVPGMEGPFWGCDLRVQFVRDLGTGHWEFYHPTAQEPLENDHWWRTSGLTIVPPDEMVSFRVALVAAYRDMQGRHQREADVARTAARVACQAVADSGGTEADAMTILSVTGIL